MSPHSFSRGTDGRDDIRDRLREDHEGYLAELAALRDECGARRGAARLRRLRWSWAVHALAEESVVYRELEGAEARAGQPGGEDERLIEHEVIEALFDKLARSRPGSLEWRARVNVARDLVVRHVGGEERELFARLERRFDAEALRTMGRDFARERDRLERLEEARAA